MAFSIKDWQSTTQVGFLRPSNFLVYIYPPAWAMRDGGTQKWNGPDLAYLAAATTLPGVQILTTENKIYGQGPMVKMPYDIGVTDINLKFYADATGKSMAYFYDWVRNIVNLSHDQGQVRSGAFSNQLSYRQDYATRIDIMLYQDRMKTKQSDPQDGSLMIFTLYDAFPVTISETSLDWQAGNEVMAFNVTFAYRSFEHRILGGPSAGSPLKGVGAPQFIEPGPIELSEKPPQFDPPGGIEGGLSKINSFAQNMRENSQKIRTQSVSTLKDVESTIYNNEYIKTAQNVVGAVSDVKKTLGILRNLNNSFKNDLKNQLKSVTGGKSLKNIF